MSDLFSDAHRWADAGAWRRDVVALHAEGPIHRIEAAGFDPFWAVIDHATVFDIERRHQEFTNGPEAVLSKRERIEAKRARGAEVRSLISMDPPDHRKYRRLTADWFKPSSIRAMAGRLDELSAAALARLEDLGGRCDFATDVALAYPLQVILRLLGLPEGDYERMLRLTQEMFGSADPDHQRRDVDPAGDGARLHGLLPGTDRRSARLPHRRPRLGDRQRHDRRRTDAGARDDGLLHPRRHRRSRHHVCSDRRRHAATGREPRPARPPPGPPRTAPERGGGDDPHRLAHTQLHANRRCRHRDRRAVHRRRRLDPVCRILAPITTRRCSRIRCGSTSSAPTPTATSPSASESTTASAHHLTRMELQLLFGVLVPTTGIAGARRRRTHERVGLRRRTEGAADPLHAALTSRGCQRVAG